MSWGSQAIPRGAVEGQWGWRSTPGHGGSGPDASPTDQRPCDPPAVSTAARGRPVGKRREGEGNRGMHSGVGRSLGIL